MWATSYGRQRQSLRGYLLDEFNPEAVQVPAAYRLNVVVRQEANNLAIQLDNSPTRVNLTVGANFTLSRMLRRPACSTTPPPVAWSATTSAATRSPR